MRKITSCLTALLIWSGMAAFAQTPQPTNDKFDNLKLNSSPAFVVLGIEPENIQRPSSPAKLVAGLQNAIVDGKLQPNVAIDFNPYLLSKKTNTPANRFDASKFMLEKTGVFKTLAQSLTVSFATSTTDQAVFGKLEPGTGIGLGLRALLVNGRPSTLLKKWWDTRMKGLLIGKLEATVSGATTSSITDMDAVIDGVVETFKKETAPKLEFNTLSNGEIDKFSSDLKLQFRNNASLHGNAQATIDTFLQGLEQQYTTDESAALADVNSSKNPLAKQGFLLEIAAGDAFVFQNNTFDGAANAKLAFWLTPSYRWDVSKDSKTISLLDVMGVVRYTLNNQTAGVDVANYLDGGLKGAYTEEKWSASLEAVYRYASETPEGQKKNHTYRATVGLSYKISDTITFSFNFGTNFDGNTATYTDPKKMFAVGGLNIGLPFVSTGK